ncbi:MAG: Bug family tripartite tricarboxylate transporter substrate binding protein [Betaproteobacteria bacterium]
MKIFQKFLIALTPFLLGVGAALGQSESDWPKKPIRMIISFPAGGSTDVLSRAVAAPLADALGQQVVVENRPGAGGMLGLGAAAKAGTDGYTIHLSALTNQAIAQALYANPPADLRRDFVPVALVGSVPHVLVVHPSVPANTVPELMAWIRNQKGNLNYASQGNGTLSHLESELLLQRINARAVHIPYKGSSFALPDLIAGNTLMMFDSLTASLSHIKSGRLKVIGLAATERSPLLPDTPTLIQGGVKGFDVDNLFAVYVPKGVATPIIAKLERELGKVLASQDLRSRMLEQGVQLRFERSTKLSEITEAEHSRWAQVVKSANVRID